MTQYNQIMLKKTFFTLIFALTVQAWSNLQVETVAQANPFTGNQFKVINIKPFLGDEALEINFGEERLVFNGCSEEEKFSGTYEIRRSTQKQGQFTFELGELFEVGRGCKPVNIIKAVLNTGTIIAPTQKEGIFRLSNPSYPSAFLLLERVQK